MIHRYVFVLEGVCVWEEGEQLYVNQVYARGCPCICMYVYMCIHVIMCRWVCISVSVYVCVCV